MPSTTEAEEPSGPWLVLGLGNPDAEYGNTRHNAGAMVVERLAERFGVRLKRSRQRAEVAEVRDGDARIVLARPTSYVNESGGPASLLLRYYKVPLERLIVVHDEIDLAAGKLQVRRGGGTAGHNGLKSLVRGLGSPDFARVRVGVGRPDSTDPDVVSRYVLGRFRESPGEVAELVDDAARAVQAAVEGAPVR